METRVLKGKYKRHIVVHQTECRVCGSPTPSKGNNQVCPECKNIRKVRNRRDFRVYKQSQYMVVSDPDPEIGYPPGVTFTPLEIGYMMSSLNHALDAGMVLKKGEQLFRVIQEPSLKQRLEPMS